MSLASDLDEASKVLGFPLRQKFNPEQGTLAFLANKAKLVPAGLLGLPADTLFNLFDLPRAAVGFTLSKLIGKSPPLSTLPLESRPGGAGTFAETFGFEDLEPPNFEVGLTGDIINALASIALLKKLPLRAATVNKPAQFLTNKQIIAGGVGSGTGANLAREEFPDFPGAEAIGGLAGGTAIALPGISPAIQTGKAILNPEARRKFAEANEPLIRDIAKKNLENKLASEIRQDPLALATLAEGQKLQADFPGVNLDIGQRSLTPSVIQRAKGAATENLASLNEKALLDQANREAAASSIQPTGSVVPFSRSIQKQVSKTNDRAVAIEQAITEQAEVQKTLASRATKKDLDELGKQARELRVKEKADADIVVRNLLDEVETKARGIKFDAQPIIDSGIAISEQPIFKFAPERKPQVIQRIEALVAKESEVPISIVDEQGKPISSTKVSRPEVKVDFAEIKALREAVNEDLRDASQAGNTTARQQRRELNKIKDVIDKVVLEGGGKKVSKAFGNFIDFFRDEFSPRFLRGINIKQTLKDSTGLDRIANEQLFNEFLRPFGTSRARQYVALFGKNPDGRILMRDAVLDRYNKDVIGQSLTIDPKKHAKFIRDFSGPFNEFRKAGIKIGDEIADLGDASKAAFERIRELKVNQNEIANDAFVSVVADKLGVKPIDKIMSEVIEDPRKAKIILGKLDKLGAQGMLGWFGDDLSALIKEAPRGSVGDILAKKLADKNYLSVYRGALVKAFGAEEASNHIFKLGRLSKLVNRLQETEISPTAGRIEATKGASLQGIAGFTASTVVSLYRAVITGRTSEFHIATVLGTQFGLKRLGDLRVEVMKEITMNPKAVNELIAIIKSESQPTGVKATLSSFGKKIPTLLKFIADTFVKRGTIAAPAVITQLAEEQAEQ